MPKSKYPSSPLTAYDGSGDTEVLPSGLPSPVPAQAGNVTGVASNHSSLTASLPPSVPGQYGQAEGAQWNDDEDGNGSQGYLDPSDEDPNLSGPHPTQPARDWKAGGLSSWDENDDYRDFTYDTSNVAESRILSASPAQITGYKIKDGDYDDNGGVDSPPSVDFTDAQQYEFGSDNSQPCGNWSGGQSSQGSISIMPVVRR